MKIPLAEVTGAVTAPEKMTAANAGLDPVTLGVSVEGGVLYATVKSGGTALIFR